MTYWAAASLLALVATAGMAQDAAPRPSMIVMYRPGSIIGAGIACPIRYHGRLVVELARGKQAEWPVPPGDYVLTNGSGAVEVNVHPGETQYMRCIVRNGSFVANADLQLVDRESYEAKAAKYERKQPEFLPGGTSAP